MRHPETIPTPRKKYTKNVDGKKFVQYEGDLFLVEAKV